MDKNLDMRIRIAAESDASGIAEVVHAMQELHSVAQRPIETTAQTIQENLRRMSAGDGSTAYVAEDAAGTVIGYCAVHWVPFLFFAGGEAYITELFVRPSHAGKGVGSELLETVIAEAKRRQCSRLSLLNGRDGQAYGRGFYKKRGWVERDRMANFVLPLK
jgi:GNAT superfamily N-acetyltransferase